MAAFVDDLDFGFKIAQRATEYGVDGFSTPQIMAFAFELREAGILSDSDFAGCPTDAEGKFYWLLDRIVRREGIGDILGTAPLGRAENRQGCGSICPQQHQEARAASPEARNAQARLFPHVCHGGEDK